MSIGGRQYGDGITSGRILILKYQYDRLLPHEQEEFEPIQVTRHSVLYHYKAAGPYTGKRYDPSKNKPELVAGDVLDEWVQEQTYLVNIIWAKLKNGERAFLFEGDPDYEFTYGAMCQALTECKLKEEDWLLQVEFGKYYSIRNVNDMLDAEASSVI